MSQLPLPAPSDRIRTLDPEPPPYPFEGVPVEDRLRQLEEFVSGQCHAFEKYRKAAAAANDKLQAQIVRLRNLGG